VSHCDCDSVKAGAASSASKSRSIQHMAEDKVLITRSISLGRKRMFIDFRERESGKQYLKISEKGQGRSSAVHIPAEQVTVLRDLIDEALATSHNFDEKPSNTINHDTLYVGNLPRQGVSEQNLLDLFREAGDVLSITFVGKGAALVRFARSEMAQMAIDKLNGVIFRRQKLAIRYDRQGSGAGSEEGAGPPPPPPPPQGAARAGARVRAKLPAMDNDPERTVFVHGLGRETAQDELGEYFEQCGTVTGATIIRRRAGFFSGLVEFESREEAQKAIDMLSGTKLGGFRIRVRFDMREEINNKIEGENQLVRQALVSN